jgi:hypothetical protein
MSADEFFTAPWSTLLMIITIVSCAILLGVILLGAFAGPRGNWLWIGSMVVLPLAILLIAAAFTVRGYILTDDALYVQRLGWRSKIELHNLVTVDLDSQAMEDSLRIWGNGGLFGFTGTFRNQKLGRYQAYATDPARAVVLKFPNRAIVLTPDNPERFVSAVLRRIHA